MTNFFNKKHVKVIAFWIAYWLIQSLFMSGGEAIWFYIIKNIPIVLLQAFVVFVNIRFLFPLFFEKKKYLLYIFSSLALIYIVFTVSFFFIDLAFSFTEVKSNYMGIEFSTNFWRILSGSSFYSLALVCSTIFQLLKIHTQLEKEYSRILMETADKIIVIKEGNKSHRINLDDVYFVKGLREYVIWHMKDKKIISLQSLASIEQQHAENGLLRIHKSYIINTKNASHKEGNSIRINDDTIPIGRKYKENVVNYFLGS